MQKKIRRGFMPVSYINLKDRECRIWIWKFKEDNMYVNLGLLLGGNLFFNNMIKNNTKVIIFSFGKMWVKKVINFSKNAAD